MRELIAAATAALMLVNAGCSNNSPKFKETPEGRSTAHGHIGPAADIPIVKRSTPTIAVTPPTS